MLSPQGANDVLAQTYARVRQHSLDICAPLVADDYGVQPCADVSPPKWHLAHTTWFFETFLLKPEFSNYQVYNPAFEYLFNSYYNGIGAQHPREQRGHISRPTLEDVFAYRRQIDDAMLALLSGPVSAELRQAVVLGVNHEQQHQELLATDIKYILGNNPTHPAYLAQSTEQQPKQALLKHSPEPMNYESFPGGLLEVGHDLENSPGFCFDNETPRHKTYLQPFRFAQRLVSNAEYLAFIEDDGYQRADLWLADGWARLNEQRRTNPAAPLYWRKQDEEWFEYRLTGLHALQPAAPVCHVSFFEADAYARWAGVRLPTEFEWEVVAANAAESAPDTQGLYHLHPYAANQSTAGSKRIEQLSGCLWQWTQSAYLPYPGYHPLPGVIGEYNGKFMSSQMVLRGGSIATPAEHNRLTYRNFFYPPDRWQFTGIRLAADVAD